MIKYRLLGQWKQGQVEARLVHSTRLDTPASREAIESLWAGMMQRHELHLFDGAMCRLEEFAVKPAPGGDSKLVLRLSTTSYKVFLGTNLYGPVDLPVRTLANPLGVSPALQTSDGFLLFGRRSGAVAYYPHRVHPFGGALEPPPAGGVLDVFKECLRELNEELNLGREEIQRLTLLGIVEDEQIRHPELIMHAHTSLTRYEIEARLDRAEHVGLHSVRIDRAAIDASLADPAFTPVGQAALTLFARTKYGSGPG